MKTSCIIVVKLGTSSIVDETTHEPRLSILAAIVEALVKLRKDGHRVVLVSSGAIGVGLRRMNLERRPKYLPKIQAMAAIGQCRLMSLWDQLFGYMQQPVAQILLTRNDIAGRNQYLNARNTFFELFHMGVIPIVNENDTLSVSEIKFGDNDTLSAITAGMLHADYLFLMTDVDCLFDKNPRTTPDAKPIEVIDDLENLEADVSSRGSSLGTGGMSTKLVAAGHATSAGVTTVITKASKPGNIIEIVAYAESQGTTHALPPPCKSLTVSDQSLNDDDASPNSSQNQRHKLLGKSGSDTTSFSNRPLHTLFRACPNPIRDRTFWLLHGLSPHGANHIDEGALRAIRNNAGLLPVGVTMVTGSFSQQEAVRLLVDSPLIVRLPLQGSSDKTIPTQKLSLSSCEVGRALVNYSAAEVNRIKGMKSAEIDQVLGYVDSEYVALRGNIALFPTEK